MDLINMPKVTAVIITHNRCAMLKKAVESVRAQTYKNIEIIVVDDASDDDTQAYGEELILSGVRYIRIEKEDSKGGNYARNIGIKFSSGKYVEFLDDDDYWLPQKTDLQVNYLEKHPSVGMVYSGLSFEYKNSMFNHPRLPNRNAYGDIISKQIYIGPFCSTITMMIRRSILDIIKGFDENVRYWQEYELSLRIIQETHIGYIYQSLAVANRDLDVKRLTNQFDAWNDTVKYINQKHKALFERLSEDNKRKKLELYYREAAYRASVALDKKEMRKYYLLANRINRRPEYCVRVFLGLSKNDTIFIESMIMKFLAFYRRSKIGETQPNE